MSQFDLPGREEKILNFWKEHKIFEKTLEIRRNSRRFVFFEGPPTANGQPGIHHFLGRSFKDLYGRYKTMRGFFVLRKAGWDTHGLPVEIEVEKALGFKSKKDIEEYGIEKFNKKAKESVWKYKSEWEEMTRKMGFWLEMKNPYITYENNYIESLWHIIKKIWSKGLLYLAHRVVPFCVRCGTPLSSHEVAQGYQKVTDRSVYIKFKLKSSDPEWKNTSILSWTTTLWTLPGNVALAVNKTHTFICISDPQDKDHWLVLEIGSFKRMIREGLFSEEVNKTFSGDEEHWPEEGKLWDRFSAQELIGMEYEPLFEVKELKSDKSYKIYEADFVSTQEGTGVVHTAVMYGEDDYDLGTQLGLPKLHTVDERGYFNDSVGQDLMGKYVKDQSTEDLITKKLKDGGLLFKTEDYEHDYPFCWRCGTALLYYAKTSWFIKMSQLKDQLLKNNSKIKWIPEYIKEGRFGQWLVEGKDWTLSRERYWGTPLPIWKCERCNNLEVIGSVKELEKLSTGSKNKYYILRHGLSMRHELSQVIISSRLEGDKYHLTDGGIRQVETILGNFKKTEEIDEIYSSPFLRTLETAQIAGKIFHKKVIVDSRLSEILHGLACEGKDHAFCTFETDSKTFKDKEDGSESRDDVRRRMANFINEVEAKHKNKKILIVSHGDPLWLLAGISLGLNEKEIKENKDKLFTNLAELKKLDWKKIPRNDLGELDLHRPFIDNTNIKCKKCRTNMKKLPDLIDVWFDSGAMPFAQWHWPFENKKVFRNQFPADFIVEGIDQTRGWFYTLLAISTLLDKGIPYKNVISLGLVLDEKGQKMSKSRGNVISPFDVMDKYGTDAARWYFYTINSPGESKLFSMKDVSLRLNGFITTIENCIRFYELYATSLDLIDGQSKDIKLIDKWLISKLQGLILEATKGLDEYDVTKSARAVEKFVTEDFSNWWLRRSRKRKEALILLRNTLLEVSKLLAPFTPFLAEDISMRLKGKELSVHLNDWPKFSKKLVNKKLEDEMDKVRNIITLGLAKRKEKQLKVRQPLKEAKLRSDKFQKDLEDLIKEELNVKAISYSQDQVEPVVLNLELDEALTYEGYARELIRQIQDMRKEAKYRLTEEVFAQWYSDDQSISDAIRKWGSEIKKDVLLKEFNNFPHDNKAYDVEKEFNLAPQRKIWAGIFKKNSH